MRFGVFYEHQLPRPWDDDAERRLLHEALEQVELADRAGFDYVWEVEHHFLEEYSHSSAPEVFLAAASQRTKRIRLGHGVVQLPPAVNHPARVAERVATLDLISDGRVDLGTGEASSAAELGGFGVERERKREQWADALDAITRMFVEQPFAGWESEWLRMPPRAVLPRPLQRPHPPLWVACSQRETIRLAARNGVGALSFSFVEPEDAGRWVREYYELIASPECVPAGFAVNPNVAVVLPMMCHADETVAIERGIDGAEFFGFSLAHYYGMGGHSPGATDLRAAFEARRSERGFAREPIVRDEARLDVRIMQAGVGSLRGAIGTPAQIRALIGRYQAAGVDQVIFVLQAGANRHDHICESLELFAAEVMPAFAERRDAREREKAARLAPAIEAALARRAPARDAPAGYVIDERGELSRARRRARRAAGPEEAIRQLGGALRSGARTRGRSLLATLVRGRDDAELERRFGSPRVQRALLTAFAAGFRPEHAHGFEGDVVYELTYAARGEPQAWTIRVHGERAEVVAGRDDDPAVLVRLPVAAFARVAARERAPADLVVSGELEAEGDLALLGRLDEMFGGPSPY